MLSHFYFVRDMYVNLHLQFLSVQVDMPVFFYIDPEFDDDPAMAKVEVITLSYTFFESTEEDELPLPLTPPQSLTPVSAN